MEPEEIYQLWAPANALWSDWVTPALFAAIECSESDLKCEDSKAEDAVSWFPESLPKRTAVIIDLPGAKSIRLAVQLAESRGFRPVPVINASPGPTRDSASWADCAVDMRELVAALCTSTPRVKALRLTDDAPPVFLLDDARTHGTSPADEGVFDNRWMVFPQDFPSAKFLKSHGIEDVLLVQETRLPLEDLAHLLLRWQEAGLRIHSHDGKPLVIPLPSQFKAPWYRALAITGLRRNRAGGFGSHVPPSSSLG